MKLKVFETWQCRLLSGGLISAALTGAQGFFLLAFIALIGLVHGAPVPNPSFEKNSGNGPVGWTFTGPSIARTGAWIAEEVFDGNHALRIDAQHGTQFWESAPIRV